MNSSEIQDDIYKWACIAGFDAPYGVLVGEHTNPKGKKYKSVTFGRCRTLDATVEIYNRNFMVLKTSSFGLEVFRDYDSLTKRLLSL